MFLLREIKQILGGDVSTKNSKMPGTSFGLSTDDCPTGSVLREQEGTVCHGCYAKRIENFRPSVKKGWKSRSQAVKDATADPVLRDAWVRAMVQRLAKLGHKYHRWHDSGDLQSDRHLSMIISVAQALPEIEFWLPTRETAMVKRALRALGKFPDNLTVRVSAAMVDVIVTNDMYPTSAVITHDDTLSWICPARSQENSCKDCRACWDRDVSVVCYPKH